MSGDLRAFTLQRFNVLTIQRFNASTLQRFNASTLQRLPPYPNTRCSSFTISPVFSQKISKTPINEPPAMTPEATG